MLVFQCDLPFTYSYTTRPYSAPPDPLAGFGGRFAAGGGAGLGKRRERGGEGAEGGSGGEGKEGPQNYC